MSFQKGQTVKWTSQASGNTIEKHGTVAEVVPAFCKPNESFRKLYSRGNGVHKSSARNHESYVVVVDRRAYWPRVSQLILVDTEFKTDVPG